MLRIELNVQGSDTRGDDSSNAVKFKNTTAYAYAASLKTKSHFFKASTCCCSAASVFVRSFICCLSCWFSLLS